MRLLATRLATAAAVLLAACGADRPVAQPDVPRWRLQPVAALSGLADTGWTRVSAVAADATGSIYVLDEGAAQIRVFDSAGAPLRVIGRKGAGPGEFGPAYGMGIGWLGDTLVVLDPGNARLARLTLAGQWIGSWPAKRITGTGVRVHQAARGAVYTPDWRPNNGQVQSLLVRYTASGSGDTLVVPDRPKDPPGAIVCPAAGGALRFFSIPFAPGVLAEPGPSGELVTAGTGAYRIAFISGGGDTLRTIVRAMEPIVVSDSEWTAGLEEYTSFRAKNPAANCDPSSPPRMRVKPILRSLTFDDVGNLWVEHRSANGDMLDVYEPAGTLLGTMRAPAHDAEIPLYPWGSRLYAIQIDETTGAQVVRAYRVLQP